MPASPQSLCEFIDASPSPFHVCATAARLLEAAGYTELAEADAWPASGKFFTVRAGSLVAWDSTPGDVPFRIVGGHTDSPNLRVKQHPDRVVAGWQVVALQPYGGAWLNSWLDRDLGISGRLSLADGGQQLVRIDDPILRVPQLAIHLSEDRKGVSPDPQRHVNAIWGLGDQRSFVGFVAERAGVRASEVLGFDLMTHDLTASAITGAGGEFVSAPRLDNQATCYAGLAALLDTEPSGHIPVLALFDHEEVGSQSDHGAQSELLPTVLERIVLAGGRGGREDFLRRCSESMVASADMAHATHPNYPERHEPGHQIAVNAGPVLKVQPNLRYATDGRTAAAFALACRQAGVALQRYEHRADLPCGSTIGPMTAARTGIPTVDVGAAQLAMHSAREVMGALDVAAYSAALAAFLAPA